MWILPLAKKLMVQIVVFLDDNETLNVVDVITIHSGLITNIKAIVLMFYLKAFIEQIFKTDRKLKN